MKSSIFRRIECKKSKKRKRSCSAGCPSSEASLEHKVKKEIFHVNHDDYNREKNSSSSNRISPFSGQFSRKRVHEKENKQSSKFPKKIETKEITKYAMEKHDHQILDFDRILDLVLQEGKQLVNRKKRARFASIVEKSSRNVRGGDEVHVHVANQKATHKSKRSRHIQYHEKVKKPRTKSNKIFSDLYNIDNFVVQSNSLKIITEKTTPGLNIPVPRYQELEEKDDECCSVKDSSQSEPEDITDELYLKYHNQYENREREYRQKFFMENKKKNGKKAALASNRNNTVAQLIEPSGINNLKFKIELDRNLPNDFEKEGNDMILI